MPARAPLQRILARGVAHSLGTPHPRERALRPRPEPARIRCALGRIRAHLDETGSTEVAVESKGLSEP